MNRRIASLSFVCAVLVVGIHLSWSNVRGSGLWWMQEIVKYGIARAAVPYFFIVSGYFLAGHFDEPHYWRREVGKRLKTLIVPFYAWSAIYFFLVMMPLRMSANWLAGRSLCDGWCFSLRTLGLDLFDGTDLTPLWYVRNLFLLVSTSCVFKFLVRSLGIIWLVMGFGACLCFDAICPQGRFADLARYGFSLSGVFYFSVGIYLRSRRETFDLEKYQWLIILVGAGLVLARAVFVYWGPDWTIAARLTLTLSIPFVICSLWGLVGDRDWSSEITGGAFPIFLMHYIFAMLLAPGMKRLELNEWVSFLLAYLICVGMPLLVTCLLRKKFPRGGKVLFGGR